MMPNRVAIIGVGIAPFRVRYLDITIEVALENKKKLREMGL